MIRRSLLTLWAAIALVLSSCGGGNGYDEPDLPVINDDGPKVRLTLKISGLTGNKGSESRATDENNYFEGPNWNYENIWTLRIIIVRPDGTVECNSVPSFGSPRSEVTYTCKVKPGELKRIYLVANETPGLKTALDQYTVNRKLTDTDKNGLENMTISRDAGKAMISNIDAPYTFVPMSEIFDLQIIPATSEDLNQTAELFVTRAAVKFSFNIKKSDDYDADRPLHVRKFSVSGIARNEYLFPKETTYDPPKSQTTSSYPLGGRFITAYSTPADANPEEYTFEPATPIVLTAPGEEKTYYQPIYLPESPKPAANSGYYVSAELWDEYEPVKDGDKPTEQYIWVEPVKLPNLEMLPRNTHVIVNITVAKNHKIVTTVTVEPFKEVKLDPTFGFEDPKSTKKF